MKKLVLTLVTACMFVLLSNTRTVSAAEPIAIDESHFPELCIREEVRNIHDKDHDGILSVDEQEAVTSFWVYKFCEKDDYPYEYNNDVAPVYTTDDLTLDFKGMEYFVNLKHVHVDCSEAGAYIKGLKYNDEYDIRVKNFESFYVCKKLETLTCFDYNGSFLFDNRNTVNMDFSRWSKLRTLSMCISNKKANFKFNNKKLVKLRIGGNNITVKNIEKSPKLEELSVDCKNIKKLDLSKNRKIIELSCNVLNAGELNIKNNTKLGCLAINGRHLKTTDISKYKALKSLILYDLKNEDVQYIDKNERITYINVYAAKSIENIDLRGFKKLNALNIHGAKIGTIDLSTNKKMQTVSVEYCKSVKTIKVWNKKKIRVFAKKSTKIIS